MNLRFVLAEEKERDFFIGVRIAAYRATIEQMFGWDDRLQNRLAGETFDQGGIHVVWRAGERVGVAGWERRSDCLWLKEVFVLPKYQRQGIGVAIVEHAKNVARPLGLDVRLRTLKANLGAKALYERNGFVVAEATDLHWHMAWRLNR